MKRELMFRWKKCVTDIKNKTIVNVIDLTKNSLTISMDTNTHKNAYGNLIEQKQLCMHIQYRNYIIHCNIQCTYIP